MDDTKIISLYLSRNEQAIAETDVKYGHYLNQVAYHILRCNEDTEEIVEDTYMAAWNAIPPEIPRVLKHFLSKITRNLAFTRLDYLTAKRRNPNMIAILSELDTCIVDRNADLDRVLESKSIGSCINRLLSKSSKQDCAIFLCRYYHCLTIHEIAGKYHFSTRTVKYRLSQMRQMLRQELNKEGITI